MNQPHLESQSIQPSKLSNRCHFREASFGDEFASANEEKSHYRFQMEISHFVRNDNPVRLGQTSSFSHALIICNGEMPDKRIIKKILAQKPFIICADGGANAARKPGITPNIIIGDFDSISESTREYYLKHSTAEFIHLKRQSDTDFEKALKYILRKKIPRVIVLGGTGKMTDHTLGNFSIMIRYEKKLDITFIDNHFEITLIRKKISFDAKSGERISLVPYPSASGITTTGLKYRLKNESLQLGTREGTCNKAISKTVTIEMKKGNLLLFRDVNNSALSSQ